MLEIAAIPQIISPGPIAVPTATPPITVATFVSSAPAVAPINRAGEKIPPNIPKPIQRLVMSNLPINSNNKYSILNPPSRIRSICSMPRPSISGKNIPVMPVIMAAVRSSFVGDQPVFFAIPAVFRRETI